MRCKAKVITSARNEQCSFKAKNGDYCRTHSKPMDIENLKKAFDICFHALKTIEHLADDPTDEAYLIARQALATFEQPSKGSEHA